MKDRAKTFMYISIGIMAISMAVQNFTLDATAQTDVGAAMMDDPGTTTGFLVLFQSGDVWQCNAGNWTFYGNPLGGVPASGETISGVKSMFDGR